MPVVYKSDASLKKPAYRLPSHRWSNRQISIAIVVLCLLLWTIGSLLPFSTGETQESAWYNATEFVKEKLKSPSSANFSSYGESHVVRLDETHYAVSGWVEAQNSFGAQTRKNWRVSLRLVEEKWFVNEVVVD